MNKTRKMVNLSLLTTIALTIYIIESYIPPLAPTPGIKLGLSNIVTLIILLLWGWREALSVLFMRITLGSIFTSQLMALIYSLASGGLCLILMCIGKKIIPKDMIWLISIIGAIGHNIGQLTIASIVVNNNGIFVYLPILLISGIITGIFTGFTVQFLINNIYIKKLFK